MDAPVSPRSTRRLQLLAQLTILWAAIIVARLIYIQIISHSELRRAARAQQERKSEIPAPRGGIFGRTGLRLAMSLPVQTVVVNPSRIPDRSTAAEILARFLNLDQAELEHRLEMAALRGRGFYPVKRRVSLEEAKRLRQLKLDYIEFRNETMRVYPQGTLAAHVVGSVDSEERGNAGIELGLHEELEGTPGVARVVRDARNVGYETYVETRPLPGKDITLTIDERIQAVCERELKFAVESERARTGSIVVMDPYNGEILAMAAYPTYDPNEPAGNDLAPRLNLAVAAPFEPGSVFKVITLAAALEETNLRPDTPVWCGNGILRLGDRVIHEAKNGYGYLSVADVLAKSSNIGAIQIAMKVGSPRLLEVIRRFGFGKGTDLPFASESGGLVRDLRKWSGTSIGSVAMGHEVSATTIQLARAISVIANGGFLVKPRIVLKRQRPGERSEKEPEVERKQIIKGENAVTMRAMMKRVNEPGGTGYLRARVPGYTSGGKTGSAQIFDFKTHQYTHRYNASYAGMAPLTKPSIVVVVTINGAAHFGGIAAAPVFSKVAGAALRILDVPKDDLPADEPEPKPAPELVNDVAIAGLGDPPDENEPGALGPLVLPAQAGPNEQRVPDFRGMTLRNVLALSSQSGLPVEFFGKGIVRSQQPPAGAVLPPGERVRVQFAR